uniref:CypA n=2 Tax=Aspergillus flavus TaxID=5059 RepID=Q5VDC9_ASPFL|nr:CypA [Aspergillus flavus]
MASNTVYTSLIGLLVALIVRSVYRVYFHPLSKIPGPKIAAITHLYQHYYDAVKGGKYIWKLDELHRKYGPVVRFNPNEVHIQDSQYYHHIYAGRAKKQDKDPGFPAVPLFPGVTVTTIKHNHHRLRRGIIKSFFSKQYVTGLEHVIQSKVNLLASRLTEAYRHGTVLDLKYVFAALTSDLTTHYVYGTNLNHLAEPDFKNDFLAGMDSVGPWIPVLLVFGRLLKLARYLPACLVPAGEFLHLWTLSERRVGEILDSQDNGTMGDQKTLLQAMATANVPEEEKTATRLQMETLNIIAGGTETTARALAVGVFHLAHKPSLLLQLRDELRTVMPFPDSSASWTQLEQLPYLVCSRGPVLSMKAFGCPLASLFDLHAFTRTILWCTKTLSSPPAQSAYFVCMDPSIFPQPEDFNPDRWVQATRDGNNLHRYLIVFSKGSRHCLGINFALAEIYLAIATVARRFDLVPYQTTVEQLQMKRDLGFAAPEKGPFTVRAKVTGLAD